MRQTNLVLLAFGIVFIACALTARSQEKKDELFTATGTIKGDYDRFEEKTKIDLRGMHLATASDAYLVLYLHGEFSGLPKPPDHLALSIVSVSVFGYRNLPSTCSLNIIADNQRFKLEMPQVKRDQYIGFYAEGYGGALSYSDFRTIARSKTVEMRFCDTEFKLTPDQLTQFYEFRRRFWDDEK